MQKFDILKIIQNNPGFTWGNFSDLFIRINHIEPYFDLFSEKLQKDLINRVDNLKNYKEFEEILKEILPLISIKIEDLNLNGNAKTALGELKIAINNIDDEISKIKNQDKAKFNKASREQKDRKVIFQKILLGLQKEIKKRTTDDVSKEIIELSKQTKNKINNLTSLDESLKKLDEFLNNSFKRLLPFELSFEPQQISQENTTIPSI